LLPFEGNKIYEEMARNFVVRREIRRIRDGFTGDAHPPPPSPGLAWLINFVKNNKF
jgi:hypothetical protein